MYTTVNTYRHMYTCFKLCPHKLSNRSGSSLVRISCSAAISACETLHCSSQELTGV